MTIKDGGQLWIKTCQLAGFFNTGVEAHNLMDFFGNLLHLFL